MEASNVQAKMLQPEEIQQLRNEVLWPHKTFENCILDTDRLSTTFHFGMQIDGLTVATVTLQKEKSDKLKQDSLKGVSQGAVQESQYRLRAMAVREGYRGLGYGDAIVEAGLKHLSALGIEVVWCDARVAALNFYRRLQFEELEEEYEIPIIGKHRFMWKVLSSHS
jgi:ribosomal protein S18 acetylase RimI-like enzyme